MSSCCGPMRKCTATGSTGSLRMHRAWRRRRRHVPRRQRRCDRIGRDTAAPACTVASAAELDRLFARVNPASRPACGEPKVLRCMSRERASRRSVACGASRRLAMRTTPLVSPRALRDAGFDTRVAGDVFVARTDTHTADRRAGARTLRRAAPVRRPRRGRATRRVAAAGHRLRLTRVGRWHPALHGRRCRARADRVDVLYLEPADADTVKLHSPHEARPFRGVVPAARDLPVLGADAAGDRRRRLHFHHVHGLPPSILQLPPASGLPYDCTLHDYYAICPQYHLADAEGAIAASPTRPDAAPAWPGARRNGTRHRRVAPSARRIRAAGGARHRAVARRCRAHRSLSAWPRDRRLAASGARAATFREGGACRDAGCAVAGEGARRRRGMRTRCAGARPATRVPRARCDSAAAAAMAGGAADGSRIV